MPDELHKAVHRLCLAFPESEQKVGHGMSHFHVRGGKTFAIYSLNHHGDGRIALWLNAPDGMQDAFVGAEPKHFFIPPYVGPRGWLGVRLDTGIGWKRVTHVVRAAYENVAPTRLRDSMGATPAVTAPKHRIKAADVDPKNSPRGKRVLAAMRGVCLELPETSEGIQFGHAVWRAGKKVFAQAYSHDGRWHAAFWVGIPAQALMTNDPRFEIPKYIGHNGWLSLDVTRSYDPDELRSLASESYRHFALKRMLRHL